MSGSPAPAIPATVRPLRGGDRAAWDGLFAAYAAFYRSPQDAAMRDRVWSWLHDPAHELEGLLAVDSAGRAVGLAHVRPFARPLAGNTGGFLDDLFVAPAARGSGVAALLIAAVEDIGRARGWSVIRWITDEGNEPARRLYDRVARETVWVTYQVELKA